MSSWMIGLTDTDDELMFHLIRDDGQEIVWYMEDGEHPTEVAHVNGTVVRRVKVANVKELADLLEPKEASGL